MIGGLKPYPEYRDSGLPWLGRIPMHWDVVRMKYVLRETDSRSTSGRETLLSVSQFTGVTPRRKNEGEDGPDTRARSLVGYKRVLPGDLVINIMLAWNGSLGVSRHSGIVSPAYCVYRFKPDVIPSYFDNVLRTPLYKGRIKASSTGVVESRLRLYSDALFRIETLMPPREEQGQIVGFIEACDHSTNRSIRAKKKLIALLNEQKQAIIHRAVTRSLDPNVRLKPSGIPWLGDIPEHWQVRKMKFLMSTAGGMTPNRAVESFWGGSVPWVSPKDMKRREISDSLDHITEVALRRTGITIISAPAVLIVVRGMILARTFPCAVTTAPVTVNQDMKALLPKPGLTADYLVSLLTGIQGELLNLVGEAGHGTRCLRTDSWQNFVVPLPPSEEQIKIGLFLASETKAVNAEIIRAQREIDLIREYRTRLIADVVTGQLDVREAARDLPAEIEEPEAAIEPDSEDETEELLEAVDE